MRLHGTSRYAFQVPFETAEEAERAAGALRTMSLRQGGIIQVARRQSVIFVSRGENWPTDETGDKSSAGRRKHPRQS